MCAHGRARQEPPQHDHVVAGQRGGHRREPGRDGRLGARPRPVAGPSTTKATATARYFDVYSRMYATHAEVDVDRPRAGEPLGRPGAGRAPPRHAVHALRVRARHGQRTRRTGRYQELFEQYPRCQGGFVWEWIDHGLRPHRRRARVLRLRRRLRRAACTTATSSQTAWSSPTGPRARPDGVQKVIEPVRGSAPTRANIRAGQPARLRRHQAPTASSGSSRKTAYP